MILYLIRHGRTTEAEANKRQSPDSPLSELGRAQAEAVAQKFHFKKLDHLYTSPWPRAHETAQIISKQIGLSAKIHPDAYEKTKTHRLNEVPEASELNQQFEEQQRQNIADFDWKFMGEGESINELITRVKKVIDFLVSNHHNDTVALVTHGSFSITAIGLLLLGLDFDQKSLIRLVRGVKIHNTGVTTFEYKPEEDHWRMLCFNDHGHLENEV